jgi:hypothetical protein
MRPGAGASESSIAAPSAIAEPRHGSSDQTAVERGLPVLADLPA